MSLPDVDFHRIRPYDGSRNTGFEELCSQIASLEPAPSDSSFFRKGRGADAGVECYRRKPDGSEIGWQAKYLFAWDSGLVAQLNDSIRTALDKHPQLSEYVVCLPFDLPDARVGKGKTARQKWVDWRERWEATACAERRTLAITLWGRSELVDRLTAGDVLCGGKILYWFGVETFTPQWFTDQFAKAQAALGARYTPETNVALPIRREFLAFTRDPDLQKEIDGWFIRVGDEAQSAVEAIKSAASGAAEPHSEALKTAVDKLAGSLGSQPIAPDQLYPKDTWHSDATQCLGLARDAMHWAYDLPAAKSTSAAGRDPSRWAQITAQKLMDVLSDIVDAVTSQRWGLANAKAVLLTGPAGIGKSHLLADIVEHQVHQGRPAVLILGSSLRDDEPWRQILTQLDRPPTEQVKHFLGGLDAAAQAAGTRALVCIDALNERNGLDIWPNSLAAFLKAAETFTRIGVILSCRSTYVPYVIPDGLGGEQLTRVEHDGFAADGGRATKVYLDKRGIVRPGAPSLLPEFENPLFLKTCCDYLEKEGKKELPRGLRGVTSIFGFYNEAITRALNQRMRLDTRFEIVPRAISGFAQLLASAGDGYVEKNKAIRFFESIRPSDGSLEMSLLSQLESEGLIAVEPIRQEDGSLIEMVRFTFERFSDHALARRLLSDHLDKGDVIGSFAARKPLHDFVFGSMNYERAGVIEALAVQLPEQTGFEILDVSGGKADWSVDQAFFTSLLWREQAHFTDRTFDLVRERLGQDDLNDLVIAISTEPSNKFNASYVHERLKDKSMPERDASWSIYLAKRGYEGEVETLISWALENGLEHIEDDRAHLASVMLTWFLTTSHRSLRDKATKGLACILSRRLRIAARLVRDFASVDDPYLSERLLAACYGAVLQGRTDGLAELSSTVFELVFAGGAPPIDALLRDHARGIIEYANWRGVLCAEIDVTAARPPYKSPWPIDYVSDGLIETYTQKHAKGMFRDAIVGSTVNDGDFARYQIDLKVDKWSLAPLGTSPLPMPEDVYGSWLKDFGKLATAAQQAAFHELLVATKSAKDVPFYEESTKSKRRKAAMTAFKALLTSDQREDFRNKVEDFVVHQLHRGWRNSHVATFNTGWARRWVCKRAHELGWTADLFGEFEDSIRSHDRHNHEVERIGKKYQWIALHELLARMSDNLAYVGEYWERRDGPQVYQDARQINLRNTDPSLLTTETHYDGWAEWGKTWWVPFKPVLRPVGPRERCAWLEADSDIVNDVSLIDVSNPKTRRRWLTLSSFSDWKVWGLREGHKELQRDTWFRLQCIVVRKVDEPALVKGMLQRIFVDPHSFPEIDLSGDFYLGEYPWHPALEGEGGWTSPEGDWCSTSVPTRPTVARYTCERGGYDYSINRTVSVEIPAPWLADAMGLRLTNGRSPVYAEASGREIFYDPSVLEAGPAAALVDRDAFVQMLKQEKLSAVWIIAGEKSVYGGRDAGRGFGGRLLHTAIYQLGADGFTRQFHRQREQPSESQLVEFYGDEFNPPKTMDSVATVAKKPARKRGASNK